MNAEADLVKRVKSTLRQTLVDAQGKRIQDTAEARMSDDEPQTEEELSDVTISKLLGMLCSLSAMGVHICEEKREFDALATLCRTRSSGKLKRLVVCLLLLTLRHHKDAGDALIDISRYLRQSGQCTDTLLLLATYFHAQFYRKIWSFVRRTAGIASETNVNMDTVQKYAEFMTQELLPAGELAKEILNVRPRQGVLFEEDSYVLQCVYYLLKGKVFRKLEVDASRWVFEHVLSFSEDHSVPIPPIMAKIITELVSNSLPHPNFSYMMALLTGDDILAVFQSHSGRRRHSLSVQSLVLYYVLLANNNAVDNIYGPGILQHCSTMHIVDFLTKEGQHLLGPLFCSQLLGLIADKLQHLFNIGALLSTPHAFPSPSSMASVSTSLLSDHDAMRHALHNPSSDQPSTKLVLDHLTTSASADGTLEHFKDDVIGMLPKLLDDGVRHYVHKSYEQLWQTLFKRFPMEVTLGTVNALSKETYSHEELYKNVLFVFRVDSRLFCQPELFGGVFLYVLESYMAASKSFITSGKGRSSNTKEMSETFILTQESVVLQMLLELCLESVFNKNRHGGKDGASSLSGKGELMRIRNHVCRFLHQRFIETPLLARMIHFQTYDASLLPIVVNGVDSIHICMDFVIELLTKKPVSIDRQVFGVQLASYLVEKFPLPRCVDIARVAIDTARQFGSFGTGSTDPSQRKRARSCVEPLARIASAFRFLAPECVRVMQEIRELFHGDRDLCHQLDTVFSDMIPRITEINT